MQQVGERGNRKRVVNGYIFSVIRCIRSEALIYRMMTIVDNNALYNKLVITVKLKFSHKNGGINVWGDGCIDQFMVEIFS